MDLPGRTTTGLLGSDWIAIWVLIRIEVFLDLDLESGEDAPQWEEGAGGGVKPGGFLALDCIALTLDFLVNALAIIVIST